MSSRYSIFKRSRVGHEVAMYGSPVEVVGSHPTVHLYCDESGNGGDQNLPLMVGALATDVYAPVIETEVRKLHAQLSARRDLRGTKYFEDFRKNGFHAKNDLPQIAEPFRRLMDELPTYRAVVVMTDRSTLAGSSEVQQIETLYEFVISETLLRYAGYEEVVCHIEQNDSLKRLVRKLAPRAVATAQRKAGPSAILPSLEVRTVKKSDVMSMAILDYVMMAVKRWKDIEFRREVSEWQFREFAGVEDSLSFLYSLEKGLLVNRRSAVHGQDSS